MSMNTNMNTPRIVRTYASDDDVHRGHGCSNGEDPVSRQRRKREKTKQKSRQISMLRESYGRGLTIHGLQKVMKGGKFEKAFWLLLVMITFSWAMYISRNLWQDYIERKVITVQTFRNKESIRYPSVTVCQWEKLTAIKDKIEVDEGHTIRPVVLKSWPEAVQCSKDLKCLKYPDSFAIAVEWVSADFDEREERSQFVSFNPGLATVCATVDGDEQKVESRRMRIILVANRTQGNYWTSFFVNEPGELFYKASAMHYTASLGYYTIQLNKKVITRLEEPYSDCIREDEKGTKNETLNIFPGHYTIARCKLTCMLFAMRDSCDVIPEQYRHYLPRSWWGHDGVNITEAEECIRQLSFNHTLHAYCSALCLPACKATYYEATMKQEPSNFENMLMMDFSFPRLIEEQLSERPAYTSIQLFSNFGGVVGLMSGTSVLSVIEVFIFVGLLLLEAFSASIRCPDIFYKKRKQWEITI